MSFVDYCDPVLVERAEAVRKQHPETLDSVMCGAFLYLVLPEGAALATCKVVRFDLSLPGPGTVTITKCRNVEIARVCVLAEIAATVKAQKIAG
jgi:hypothetical protein